MTKIEAVTWRSRVSATLADTGPYQTSQLQFDSNYLYLCTATNTFKCAALSSY